MRNSRVRKTSLEIPALIVYSLSAEERVNSILEMFEKSDVSAASRSANTENNMNKGNISVANGKLPEDIPSADNDSALAAQIRHAAENETDPVKKAQLWNEYRKYKGLPQK